MSNLIKVFRMYPSIPVAFVVEPIVKQLQLQEEEAYRYGASDFDFFLNIASHPKLSVPHALHLIDIMAKLYLTDMIYATSCS